MKIFDEKGNRYIPPMKIEYTKRIVPQLIREFGFNNNLQVPKLLKIVLNVGKKNATIDQCKRALQTMTGQKPLVCLARKSCADFKIREGEEIGVKVTCRGDSQDNVLQSLMVGVFRLGRKFKPLKPKNFIQGKGVVSVNLGFHDFSPFPGVKLDVSGMFIGFNASVVIRASKPYHAMRLMALYGFPIVGIPYDFERCN